jgi:hypothetical protein
VQARTKVILSYFFHPAKKNTGVSHVFAGAGPAFMMLIHRIYKGQNRSDNRIVSSPSELFLRSFSTRSGL